MTPRSISGTQPGQEEAILRNRGRSAAGRVPVQRRKTRPGVRSSRSRSGRGRRS